MKIQRGTNSDRLVGISFSSNINPILSSFQKGIVAKMMDSKRFAVDPFYNELRSHSGRIS